MPSMWELMTSSAGKAYARSWVDRGIWGTESVSPQELNKLREIAAAKIKKGSSGISYSDYGGRKDESVDLTGYGSKGLKDASSVAGNLTYLLGKAALVKDLSGQIMVADEYDFPTAKINRDASYFERTKQFGTAVKDWITDNKKSPYGDAGRAPSMYGLAHLAQEAYGSREGEGASIRIPLGTAKELGIPSQTANRIPSLSQYEQRANMNKANVIKPPTVQRQAIALPEKAPAYTVQRGDSLWKIANKLGTSVDSLVKTNSIKNPSLIYPGQELKIP